VRDLPDASHVLVEVADDLSRLTRNCVTLNTTSASTEEQRALFLICCERILLTARVPIYRGICEYQAKLKFRDRFSEHIKIDRRSVLYFEENFTKEFSLRGHGIQAVEHFSTNGKIVSRNSKHTS